MEESLISTQGKTKVEDVVAPNAFERIENQRFFENDQGGIHQGMKFIAAQSQTHLSLPPSENWDEDDILLDYKLTQLCSRISQPKREMLAEAIHLVKRQTLKNEE